VDEKASNQTNLTNGDESKETLFLIAQYQVIANNRVSHNELFWNFQIMFLMAQSFLLILALGGFTQIPWERAVGGFIAFVFGALSIQGFERNRAMEIADAELLLNIEKRFKDSRYIGLKVHDRLTTYKYFSGKSVLNYLEKKKIMNFFSRGISYGFWKCGMWLITFVAFSLFLYNTFLFCFSSSFGRFLWYDSFDIFKSSFDRSALGAVVVILALNWIFYMVDMLQEQQPKKYPKEYKNKQIKDEKAQAKVKKRKAQKSLYLRELILILVAFVYTIFAYYHVFKFIPFMWLGVLFICLGLLVRCYRGMLREIREAVQQAKRSD